MALSFILDGYNIIKSDESGVFAQGTLEQQRALLIALIKKQQPQGSSKNTVTVVFDSAASSLPYESAAALENTSGVSTVFSAGKSADDTIEEIVLKHPNRPEVVVVTNDKGIRRRLGGCSVKFMSVQEFLKKLFPRRQQAFVSDDPDSESLCDINEELGKQWLK